MGKPKHPDRLSEGEARSVLRNLRTSPQKLNLVAQSIRGTSAEAPLPQLTFPKRLIDVDAEKELRSANANAERHHQHAVHHLNRSDATVGKSCVRNSHT